MNQILKIEIEKMNSAIKGKWTPELDTLIQKSMDAIMSRNIITLDSVVVNIMSKESKWTSDTFSKYFVFLEGIRSHIDNIILEKTKKIRTQHKEHELSAFSFLGTKVKIARVSKKSGLFVFELDDSHKESVEMFETGQKNLMISEGFLDKVVNVVVESVINGTSLLNVNDLFLIGKDEDGRITVLNTIAGLVELNKVE